MSKNKFAVLCEKYNVLPEIALENENIVEALQSRDDELVEKLLKETF